MVKRSHYTNDEPTSPMLPNSMNPNDYRISILPMKAHSSVTTHYTIDLLTIYQDDTMNTLRSYATQDIPNFPKISQLILMTENIHALTSNNETHNYSTFNFILARVNATNSIQFPK